MSAPTRTPLTLAAAVALAIMPSRAAAQDAPERGIDFELVRSTFSYRSIPGLDTPDIAEEGQIRMGVLAMYERDPLVLYEFENELGGIVGNRATMQLGVSWDFFERAGARLTLPVNANFGSTVPELDADTAGLGDIGVGVHFLALNPGGFKLGVRADMLFPSNLPSNAWLGESDIRPVVGLLVRQDIGRFSALLDTGATIRTAVDTEQDFVLGSELSIAPGLLYAISPDVFNAYASGFIHGGFNNFFGGEAENPIETVIGAQIFPKSNILIDVGGGRGWNQGYGTTDFRLFAGVTYTFLKKEEPPPPEPEPVVELYEIPPENVEELVAEVQVWEEGQLARVENDRIVIREPIQFYLDTTQILPESLPTLRYVAKLLNQKGEIDHVQIEGHASEEGSYEYNYDLSTRRARAIWEELIRSGVHPDRLSYKGMGEVVPIQMGEDEESLSANRRVEFDIIKQLGPLDIVPEYPDQILLPWNGQRHTVNQAKFGEELSEELRDSDIIDLESFDDALEEEEEGSPGPATLPEPESKGELGTGMPEESEDPGGAELPEAPDEDEEEEAAPAPLPPAPPPTEEAAPAEEDEAEEAAPAPAQDSGSAPMPGPQEDGEGEGGE